MKDKLIYLWYVVIVAIFLGPWASLSRSGSGNIFLFRALFLVFAIISVFSFNYRKKYEAIEDKKIFYFFILWIFICIFQMSYSNNISISIKAVINFIFITGIIYYTVIYVDNFNKLSVVFNILLLIYGVFLLVGIWENITGSHLWVSEANNYTGMLYLYRKMPTSFYNNPNDFATFISLYLPFVVIKNRYEKNVWLKVLYILMILVSIDFLLVTSSKANMFSVIIGFLVLIAFSKGNWKKKVINLCILLCVVFSLNYLNSIVEFNKGYYSGTILKALSLKPKSTKVETDQLFSKTDIQAQGGSVKVRVTLAEDGLKILKETKLMGAGAANSPAYLRKYNNVAGLTNFHNFWVEILASYGILVFIPFICIYIYMLFKLYTMVKKNKEDSFIGKGSMILLMSLAGFSIACVSSSSVMMDMTVWFIFAISITLINIAKKGESK